MNEKRKTATLAWLLQHAAFGELPSELNERDRRYAVNILRSAIRVTTRPKDVADPDPVPEPTPTPKPVPTPTPAPVPDPAPQPVRETVEVQSVTHSKVSDIGATISWSLSKFATGLLLWRIKGKTGWNKRLPVEDSLGYTAHVQTAVFKGSQPGDQIEYRVTDNGITGPAYESDIQTLILANPNKKTAEIKIGKLQGEFNG